MKVGAAVGGIGVGVSVGSGVSVDVGVGGIDVGVSVGSGVEVGIAVGIGVGVSVGSGVSVGISVGTTTCVAAILACAVVSTTEALVPQETKSKLANAREIESCFIQVSPRRVIDTAQRPTYTF